MTTAVEVEMEIGELERSIYEAKQRLLELRKKSLGEEVGDYVFKSWDGSEVRLGELFGDKSDLILVHNMGRSCSYCTLWADGLNGQRLHLENRAS